jgi:hypothetical protein
VIILHIHKRCKDSLPTGFGINVSTQLPSSVLRYVHNVYLDPELKFQKAVHVPLEFFLGNLIQKIILSMIEIVHFTENFYILEVNEYILLTIYIIPIGLRHLSRYV